MKLNLGGGDLKFPDFINVDLSEGADLKHDLRNPLPYENKSVDEIIAIHVIESFYQWELPKILKDWQRVLKTNGKITIEFTVLIKAISLYLSSDATSKLHGHWGLYGSQERKVDPIILHHYVYEEEELKELLINAGFKILSCNNKGVIHHKVRDLRIICVK